MKFILKMPFKENSYSLMRKVGYHFQKKDEEKGELIFVSPPRGYPRFHLYLKVEKNNLIFNLHLDQKKPTYEGTPAHAGEYNSGVVEKEAERIRQILEKLKNAKN
jgi:hypothetical protein